MRGRWWRVGSAFALAAGTLLGVVGGLAVAPAGAANAQINLGVVCSCTGPEATSTSTSAPALQAWADSVNAAGGINGHHVNLIVEDDQTNPGTSLAEVETLVGQDHVIAIFDNSDVDNSWETYVQQHHVPVVGSYADSIAMYTNPDFFSQGTTYNWGTADTIFLAKKAHIKKFADLYCAEVAICGQGIPMLRAAAAKNGLALSYTAAIGFAAPNYTAECLAAQQSGADGMLVGDASAIVVKVANNCAAQNYSPTEISGDGTVSSAWLTTPSMNGNLDYQPNIPFFVDNTPATKQMYAAIKKYSPALASSPNFGEVAVEAWSSGKLFQAAAAAGHFTATPTAAEVIAGLYNLHGATLGGLAPPLTYTKGKPTTTINCVFVMGIKNGKWTLPLGDQTYCPK